jgi:hypothetical protein
MIKNTLRRSALVLLLAAGSVGATAGVAGASGPTAKVQLTPKQTKAACGSFVGTIIFGDGSGSIDCSTGVATIPNDPFEN